MNNFKQEIERLVKERKAKYQQIDGGIDVNEITATFRREEETTNGYNGRQLLELIQNADDAKSDEILIELNTDKQTLIIANKGNNCVPFSIEGVKSLFLANLSSKNSNDYIGNKGLGFRSIINWSDEITINSNGLDIAFSQDIAIEEFKDSGLQATKLPILAIPKLEENPQNDWKTRVSIKYKSSSLEYIKEQIDELNPEVLLFLNHLKTIVINIDGEKHSINKLEIWTIEPKTGDFPAELLSDDNDEKTKYELKIAFNDKLSNNGSEYLFSYFTTNIKIDMPFIVHGTFDLDSTRNQLNTTDKNKFILKELVDLIIDTAKKISKNDGNSVSYKALSFLNYEHKNEVLDSLGFYENIHSAIEELEIYPCLDGEYHKKEEVVYCNDLSKFVEKNTNFRELLYLLIPTDNESIIEILNGHNLDDFSWFNNNNYDDIESLNKAISTIDDRVNFICILVEHTFEEQIHLLIDDEENLIIEDDAYTPSSEDFALPDYVHIKFINKDLHEKITEKIGANAQDILEKITNIKQFNKTEILRKVITSTNEKLELENADTVNLIKSMLKCLYHNYSDSITISNQNIQLLDKQQELQKAKDLYLSKTYPSGALTEELFGDIFADSYFLADADVFDLGNEQEIEDFFLWLGVNQYTKFKNTEKEWRRTDYKKLEVTAKFSSIEKFDKIRNLPLVSIITWLIFDKNIESKLEVDGEYQYQIIRYSDFKNNVLLQLEELFKDYLISDNNKINNIVNSRCIDYGHKLFKENNIHKSDIDSFLLKVGAIDKFQELSFEKINSVLRSLPEKDPNGKLAEKIYIESFKTHKENNMLDDDIDLFAKKEGEMGYFPQDEVSYTGNIKLPKEYTETLAIFDYPKKHNAEKIVEFFRVEDSSIIQPIITNQNISKTDNEFQTYFQKIKVYILAYRLENLDKEQNIEAKKIDKLKIKLCDKVSCKIDDIKYNLSDYDYLIEDGNYLIKIPNIELDNIRQVYDFYTIFGNIIGFVFNLENTDKFENCIKDSENNIARNIKEHIGKNAIDEARELLGISSDFYNFWKKIYDLLGKEYTNNDSHNLELINEELGLFVKDKSIEYDDLTKNSEVIIAIFTELKIDILKFNKGQVNEIDLSNYHQKNLEDCFSSNKYNFKQCLHKKCIEKSEQQEFLTKVNQFKAPRINFKTDLDVDYQQECIDFIQEKFDFELSDMLINIDSIYKKNKKDMGGDFEIIENNDEIKSLLYFEGHMNEVNSYVANAKKPKDAPVKEQNPITGIIEAEFDKLKDEPKDNFKTANSSSNSQSYSEQNKQKSAAGKREEKRVNQFLIKKYGKENVIWVSEEKPNADHDFKYKDNKDNWWFVEVKTMSNDVFYISKAEKEFAESNHDKYKIFLVESDIKCIYPVDFDDDKLKIEATNFSVRYLLKDQELLKM